ncbi:MAG: TonB-dependent receptor [Bacteroidetes bacterium]|nr:TonB-dependent receptor [Bacteroidota bacterium]
MKRRLSVTLLFFCLLLQAAGQSYTRFIQVSSQSTGLPIANAEVNVDFRPGGPLLLGKTDSTGFYGFNQSGAFKLYVNPPADSALSGFHGVFSGVENEIRVALVANDLTINPVTVVGTIGPRALSQNPYNVRVISREKINLMAAQNLGDVLQNEVNVQLGQDQVMGTSAIMQGIGGQDIKILINGIPVIGRLNGNVDLGQIMVNNVERIEIIEGPMSVVYGTDALGGVINIITRNVGKQRFHTRLNSYTDNLQNYNFDINTTTRLGKNTPLSVNIGRYFYTGTDFDPSTRTLDWKPKTRYFADAFLFWNAKNSTHRFTSSVFTEKLTDRSDAEYNLTTITGFNSFYNTTRLDHSMHSVFKLNNHSRFEIQNAFNYYARTKNTIKRNLVTGAEATYRPEDQDTSKFSLFNSRGIYSAYNPDAVFNWSVGYDGNIEHGSGKRMPDYLPGITDIAAFGAMEYSPVQAWQFRPGVRFIYNSRFGTTYMKSLFGNNLRLAPIIPSLQVKYQLSEHLAFRASYSRGFRAPSIKELNFLFVDVNHNVHGNDSLKAETSDNFILSFDYRHKLPAGMGTMFGFSLFNNLIKNKISLALMDARSNLYTYINIGRYRSQGLNMNFEFFSPKFGFKFSSSLLTVYDLLKQADTFNQKYYLNGQVGMNFSYRIPSKRLSFNLFSRYTSPTRGYTENYLRYRIGGFYLADITIQKTFQRIPLDINLGVKNLLGVTNVGSTRRDAANPHSQEGFNLNITPGRTLFVKLAYSIF